MSRRRKRTTSTRAARPDATVVLAAIRDALDTNAVSGGEFTADAARAARTAVLQLRQLAPQLHAFPDLLGEMRHVLAQAESRALAFASARPELLKSAPTGSSPIAAGGAAGAWAGMHAQRTDAVGVPNADFLRRLASKNPWVSAAITTRKQQIGRADIAVVPADETKPFNAKVQRTVERLLNFPNEYRDSYRSLMEPVLDDILVLDRGCISKSMDARRIPHGLYYEDGSTIKIVADWNGDPALPRYVYAAPDGIRLVPLRNDELICIMANAASYRFGLSPVQVLLDTIRADLAATDKAANLVRDVPPPHLVHLKNATQNQVNALRSAYEMDVAGKRELMFMGTDGDISVYPMMFSLKDNQFLEWQTYLARKICAVFQISPQQIGITFDINKATAEVQQDITEDAGLIPLLLLLEEFLNRELLADFAPVDKDGRPNIDALNLRIIYPEVSEISRMLHAERVLKMALGGLSGLPLLTPNMALKMLGEEPVPGGNTFWVDTKNGPMPWLSYDGETGDYGRFATAGDLGAQDPEGGIDEDEATPRDTTQEKPDRGRPTDAPGGPADQSATTTDDAPSVTPPTTAANDATASAPATAAAKQVRRVIRRDTRKPGQHWRPEHERTVPLMLTGMSGDRKPRKLGKVRPEVAAAHHKTVDEVTAAAQLATDLRAIFEEAQQRGTLAG